MAFYRLVMTDDTGHVTYFPIVKRLTRIGRGKDMDIVLKDGTVSKAHAVIREKDEMIGIKDTQSTNGTFVNDRRLTKAVRLRPGDEIIIGAYRFHVEEIDEKLEGLTAGIQRPKWND